MSSVTLEVVECDVIEVLLSSLQVLARPHFGCVLGPLLKFNLAHLILPLMRLANDSEIH